MPANNCYFKKTDYMVHFFGRWWGRTVLLFFNVKLIDNYKLPKDKAFIIMSNHQSIFDIFLTVAQLNTQFRFMSKASLFNIPIFGLMMKLAGYISIDRENPRQAVKAISKGKDILNKGVSVLIFPEGTWCNEDGELLRFKRGGFIIAKKTKFPILPVTITKNFKVLAGDSWLINSRKMEIIIDKPIVNEEINSMTEDELMDKIKNIFQKNLSK